MGMSLKLFSNIAAGIVRLEHSLRLLVRTQKMPFTIPTFNVPFNGWRQAALPPGPPRAYQGICNFSLGKRVVAGTDQTAVQTPGSGVGIDVFLRIMMVAAATDVRGRYATGGSDVVEVPAGSGAFYLVGDVADMAKGFANEHRVCWCSPFFPIPFPNPLP